MRQIRADHDQRLRTAPKTVEQCANIRSGRITDQERQQRELADRNLQERQLDL